MIPRLLSTRLLHDSRLPLEKSLDAFDLKRLPRKLVSEVRALLEGTFLDRAENVLAFGNPGTGKTHLLCAIGQELIHRGHRILFSKCSLLVQEMLIAKRELRLARTLKALSKYEAMIIDDIGYVQQDREEMEVPGLSSRSPKDPGYLPGKWQTTLPLGTKPSRARRK